MKIGFDGKRALNNMTGLGNYSRLVIESLAREYPADTLTVFAPAPRQNPRTESWRDLRNIAMRYPLAGEAPLGKAVWRTWGITRTLPTEGIDIFHGLSNELPLNIARAGIPSVVTIHDVIYRTMPECYKPIDRRLYDYKYGHAARNATKVIAISECTKRDVMRFYGVPEDRIEVIYQDCHPSFRKAFDEKPPRDILDSYSLPEKYIVQVGTIEMRKNALLSVQALAALRERFPSLTLVLVGRPTPYLDTLMKEAERLRVADRIAVRPDISFKHLPAVVYHACAALYPSRYEGFGLPVLEALNCGTPTVAATGSCLEEAGGDAAVYVHPDNAKDLADAVESILSDPVKTASMRTRGLDHAAAFTRSDMASLIHNLYISLLRRKN